MAYIHLLLLCSAACCFMTPPQCRHTQSHTHTPITHTQLKDAKTIELIAKARARGVVVHEPEGPLPAADEVDVLVVSNNHMEKCAMEVPVSPVQVTNYLASGVFVVSENFLMHLVQLPTAGPVLQLPPAPNSPAAGLCQDVQAAFFQTGAVRLLLLWDVGVGV